MRETAKAILASGTVIPAMPLVLQPDRTLDEKGQRRLIRYYLESGAGGLAAAVHTTQFAIRDHGLFEPVLSVAADEISRFEKRKGKTVVRIAGVCGPLPQAEAEAQIAANLGYDAVLLSPGGLLDDSEKQLLDRTKVISSQIPVIGFYLQPSVGGRLLEFSYWQKLCEIDHVVAIKVAPFDRYLTLDVLRAVALSGRSQEIALYTGNDDHIILDLIGDFSFVQDGCVHKVRFAGGLLGHFAIWTSRAVSLFDQLMEERDQEAVPSRWLTLASQITDCNSAVFDAAHRFKGCIAGIHEILRRQGLLDGIFTLDEHETLSPGQSEELDRICRQYPHLQDDDFVARFLENEEMEGHS